MANDKKVKDWMEKESPSVFNATDKIAYRNYVREQMMDGKEPLGPTEWYKKHRRKKSGPQKVKEEANKDRDKGD